MQGFQSTSVYRISKWIIVIAAYSFLIFKLTAFNQYNSLLAQWEKTPMSQWIWLIAVLMLLPLNWLLEAIKWRMLTSGFQKISIGIAIKAVLTGISTGFFTPNRVGELVGRILYLTADNRKAGITMSFVNSVTQNLVIAVCGIPAALYYFYSNAKIQHLSSSKFIITFFAFAIILGLLYFLLPRFSKFLSLSSSATRIKPFTDCLLDYSQMDLMRIILISLLRFIVFSFQFFLMLQFFGVQLSALEALMAIPTSYLFVTFSPSFAFSEVAVRSSYAVLFIGAYSNQVVNIALAGVSIWAVNFVVPMLIGSVLMMKSKYIRPPLINEQ